MTSTAEHGQATAGHDSAARPRARALRGMRRQAAVIAALACAAGALPAAAAAQSTTAPSTTTAAPPTPPTPSFYGEALPVPGTEHVLSDERISTTWAHSLEPAPIQVRPEAHARRLARLSLETEDGYPEVYLLLRTRVDEKGVEWVQLRIPGRPNGRVGWVHREALGDFHVTHWLLVVNRETYRMHVYYRGVLRLTAPVGVGKPSTPTPPGRFWIRERFPISDPSNAYWPYAFGTSDYSTLSEWPGGGVVGIHGPYESSSLIPGAPSHGCIRMHVGDISWLAGRITLGTPLRVL